MPYNPIPTAPGTGISYADAWAQANTMFNEVFNTLGDFGDAIDAQELLFAGINTALAKTIVKDAAQANTLAQKLQHAINAGTLVSLFFPLVSPAALITTAVGTFNLPYLPEGDFFAYDAILVIYTKTGVIDYLIECELKSGSTIVFSLAESEGELGAGGNINMQPQIADSVFQVADSITLVISTVTNNAVPTASGLGLWLRGVWES
jgi:hypothetical protein